MGLSRRHFLRGIIAVGVVASVPASIVKAITGHTESQKWATEKLTAAFNAQVKGTGLRHCPRFIYVGRDLFEMYESETEVHRRFTAHIATEPDGLIFKHTLLIPEGRGYDIKRFV